jgi:AbrB family looped-hinge helix DNA binding protein
MNSSKRNDAGKAPSSTVKLRRGSDVKSVCLTKKVAPKPRATGSITLRHLSVPKDGRLVIPADLRDALGLRDGGTVVAEVRDGALVIETMATRLRRLRELVHASDKGTGSVVEEFLAEKRTEAARE